MFQQNTSQSHTSCILSLGTLAESILQYSWSSEFMMLRRFAYYFRVYINNDINPFSVLQTPFCRFWYLGNEEVCSCNTVQRQWCFAAESADIAEVAHSTKFLSNAHFVLSCCRVSLLHHLSLAFEYFWLFLHKINSITYTEHCCGSTVLQTVGPT